MILKTFKYYFSLNSIMKFFQGFFGILALASALLYAGFEIAINMIANTAMLVFGFVLLAIDVFALAVWVVNWKYYSQD